MSARPEVHSSVKGGAVLLEGVVPSQSARNSIIEAVVHGMLDRQILWDEAGVLWLGREGQDAYGRKNFLELVSVFTAAPLFAILHGRHEHPPTPPAADV